MSESSAAANPDWKARALPLTPTQLLFVEWNAQRLGIAPDESLRRFLRSAAAVPNGHAGTEFRAFNSTCYELYQVFWDDNARELFEAYRFHAPMHFLRMLSYGEPSPEESLRITRNLPQQLRTTILDFGCGCGRSAGCASADCGPAGVVSRPVMRPRMLLARLDLKNEP